jgi:molybdopterin molybdotransferase
MARMAARVRPVAAQNVEPVAALGRVLAQNIDIELRIPPAAVALRDGWAVKAELTTDAGPYAPVPIPAATRVQVGGTLGPEHDAVLPVDAVSTRGGRIEAVVPVASSDGVLRAGGDLPAGARTLQAGRRIIPPQAALCNADGMKTLPVRVPRLQLTGARAGADWVIHTAMGCIGHGIPHNGGEVTNDDAEGDFERALADADADAVIVLGGSGCGRNDRVVRTLASAGELVVHGIGLIPGETAAFGIAARRPVLVLPGRLDAALTVWHVLGRVLLRQLAGSTEPLLMRAAKLTQKVSSHGGLAELVRFIAMGATHPCGRKALARTEALHATINAGAADLMSRIRRAARQVQFLEVVSEEEARARFVQHLDLSPLPSESVALSVALGRPLAHDVKAPLDCRRSTARTWTVSPCALPILSGRATACPALCNSMEKSSSAGILQSWKCSRNRPLPSGPEVSFPAVPMPSS